MMTLDWTWIAAIAGGIGVFWKQMKALIDSIKSMFIVVSEIPSQHDVFLFYCWDHFKSSKLGTRRFGFENFYLRPYRRLGTVGMEFQGKRLTFWHGYWPLFLTLEPGKGFSTNETLNVTYIRGTFDIKELIRLAAEYHNKMKWGLKSKTTHRYKIIRKFGFVLTSRDERGAPDMPDDSGEKSALASAGRPVGMSRDDLGVPLEQDPFRTLFYGNEVHDFFTKISRWKSSRDWYHKHTITWRLGGLLEGVPGTGKTSFVRAAAQTLDFPIMIIDLPSMSNKDLTEAWRSALSMGPMIVLFEDIDRLFTRDKQFKINDQAFSMRDPVSLDCVLNCISGVEPSEGIITIATANNPEFLDPALLRPGRLDFKIPFALPCEEDRRKIAGRILDQAPELIEPIVKESEGHTGAAVVQMATEQAILKYWANENRKNGNGKKSPSLLDMQRATRKT